MALLIGDQSQASALSRQQQREWPITRTSSSAKLPLWVFAAGCCVHGDKLRLAGTCCRTPEACGTGCAVFWFYCCQGIGSQILELWMNMPNRQVPNQPCLVGQNSFTAKVIGELLLFAVILLLFFLSYHWLYLSNVSRVAHSSLLCLGLVRNFHANDVLFFGTRPHCSQKSCNECWWLIYFLYFTAEITSFDLWNYVGRKDPPLGKEGSKFLYLIHCTFYDHVLLVLLYFFFLGWQIDIRLQEKISFGYDKLQVQLSLKSVGELLIVVTISSRLFKNNYDWLLILKYSSQTNFTITQA